MARDAMEAALKGATKLALDTNAAREALSTTWHRLASPNDAHDVVYCLENSMKAHSLIELD